MEGLHLLSDLGAPVDSPVSVSRYGQGKGSLGLAAEAAPPAAPAAPTALATQHQISSS